MDNKDLLINELNTQNYNLRLQINELKEENNKLRLDNCDLKEFIRHRLTDAAEKITVLYNEYKREKR